MADKKKNEKKKVDAEKVKKDAMDRQSKKKDAPKDKKKGGKKKKDKKPAPTGDKVTDSINKLKGKKKKTMKQVVKEREVDQAIGEKEAEKIYGKEVEGAGQLGRIGDVEDVRGLEDPDKVKDITGLPNVNAQTADATKVAKAAFDANTAAGQRDAYVSDALKRQQANLGGYSSAENQALVEKAISGIDDDAASQMRQLQIMQGQAGQTGDAAVAQRAKILKNQAMLRQGARQDVLARNVQQKAENLQNYANTSGSAATQLAAQKEGAMSNLGNIVGQQQGYGLQGQQSNQATALSAAQSNQQTQGQNVQNQMVTDAANLANDRANQNTGLEVQKFDIGQGEKESAGIIGMYVGDQGTTAARRSEIEANKLAKEGLDIAKAGVDGSTETEDEKAKRLKDEAAKRNA